MTPEEKQNEQLMETRRLRRQAQKRKRLMQQRAVIFMLALIAVLSLLLVILHHNQKPAVSAAEVSDDDEFSEIETNPDTIIHLAAVGDIAIDDSVLAAADRLNGEYDFSAFFSAVSPLTANADCTIGNLELGFFAEPYGTDSCSAPDSLAETLSSIGFDVVQTANTCAIQSGLSGLERTIRVLDGASIAHVGTYATQDERLQSNGVTLQNVNGVTIAFVGYTKGLGGMRLPENAEYAVDLLYDDYDENYEQLNTEKLLSSIEAAKEQQPDVIIALMHWGSEGEREVSSDQEALTELLFENGVDAIIGTHSHLVGPMEKRTVQTDDGETKTCFVAYSLGNFFCSQDIRYTGGSQDSVILNLEFTKDGRTGKTGLTDVSYTPIYFMIKDDDSEVAYEVLPIRSAIQSGLFDEEKELLSEAISDLRSYTDSDFDSGK